MKDEQIAELKNEVACSETKLIPWNSTLLKAVLYLKNDHLYLEKMLRQMLFISFNEYWVSTRRKRT